MNKLRWVAGTCFEYANEHEAVTYRNHDLDHRCVYLHMLHCAFTVIMLASYGCWCQLLQWLEAFTTRESQVVLSLLQS